ncbi:hypothetical protein [Halodesulfovibrio sp.]|uniref:hypothetical protein n=1 Tax=Halodesulfovibrio sp. TaxID=1912772 RepID=UPI0025B7C931|nr:hypothetical protein [Halodesulfovibrio sp.]
MRRTTLIWIAIITLVPILSALAMQYETRRNSGAIYMEKPEQKELTLIINTADPQKAETTLNLATDLYNKGVDTTVLLEGSGVTLLRSAVLRSAKYEGGIAVCPHCMEKFGIRPNELPSNAYKAPDELTFSIHAGDTMRPAFE